MTLPYPVVFMMLPMVAIGVTACSTPEAGAVGAGAGAPPVADKQPKTITVHGDSRVDNYFWMREKDNPKVMAHLHAEDAYTDAVMKPTAAFQDVLFKEMVGHVKEDDDTAAYLRDGYCYFTRTKQGLQYRIYLRKKGSLTAPEEVLVDLNELARGQSFMAVDAFVPSDDATRLAYSTDNTGYRQYTLHVKNLETGAMLPERLERVTSVVWAADNKTLFYTTEDPVTKRSNKLFRHVVGADRSELVHDEKDELFDIYVTRTRDRAMIVLQIMSKTSTECRVVPAATPAAPMTVISPREPDHEYDVEHRGDLFYVRSNKGAKNFRVVTAPVSTPGQAHWTELVAHRPEVKVETVEPFAGHLVLSEWENGLQQLEVIDLGTAARHRVSFPEPVYGIAVGRNEVFATHTFRYDYESLVSPSSVYDYDMTTRQTTLVKQNDVPNFDKADYVSERVFATASDGTKIPISLVSRKGVPRDGSAPMLLYAYGSYGFSIAPTFSSARLALLDRGVVYGIAHIRGGGELGEPWRDAGRMIHKVNTFTDFIASAEYLVVQKYTSAGRLVIQGGSAGGMLMGAVANMRPDLFKGVIAQVPFVDILNTMLDASLPLTTSEYIEWGNPNEKPAYDYMATYSPYDNVKAQAYPAMLVKVSVNDSQVPYWEGAKLVAKLREMKTDHRALLLKVNFGAGHGGASGRYDALHETAFNWAFLLWQVGIGQ